MKLACIFEIDGDEEKKYRKICDDLVKKFGCKNLYDVCHKTLEEHSILSRYAMNVHTGKIKDGIQLTELELSMICDGGFSHFGGSSNIYADGTFRVEIYTD